MLRLASLVVALSAACASASAEDFYAGKTVTIVTSTGVGGTYDVSARAIARHMGRFIPGNPGIVVQNMPGAGNVLATNYMYVNAPKDGTFIAVVHAAMPLHQVLDGRGVRYDAGKFNWLGSTGPENEVIIVWNTAGVSNFEQATRKEVVLGGTGEGSGIFMIPMAMNNVLGTKFKMVIGYKSSEDVNLAMQRGEIQSRAFSMGSIVSQHPDWIRDHAISFIAQAGAKRASDLPDVPLLSELARTDEQRQIMQMVSSTAGLGKPFLAPPGVDPERVAMLRKAFAATLSDPQFIADAEKLNLRIDPMSADEVTQIVAQTIGAGPAAIAKTKAAVASPEETGKDKAAR